MRPRVIGLWREAGRRERRLIIRVGRIAGAVVQEARTAALGNLATEDIGYGREAVAGLVGRHVVDV